MDQHLAVNIARQKACQRQLEIARWHGVEVIEVRTDAPTQDPNKLDHGQAVCNSVKATTLEVLSGFEQ